MRKMFAFVGVCIAGMLNSLAPAFSAQSFYAGKTLTLIINYGAGGNADTIGRVFAHYLEKHVPGHPTIIVQNLPGAGGLAAQNVLGLDTKPDGLTAGFFTVGAVGQMIDEPSIKIKIFDLSFIGGTQGWVVAFAGKDLVDGGMKRPADLVKATKTIVLGGYSRSSAHDVQLRLSMDLFGVKYKIVTGYPSTGDVLKALQQDEVNLTSSSLPGYETQVLTNFIKTGIAIPLWQYPVSGTDGRPIGNPSLTKQGIPLLSDVYKQAFGKDPSGMNWKALMMLDDVGTQLQSAVIVPRGCPPDAVAALRSGFAAMESDNGFISDYQKITHETPNFVDPQQAHALFARIRTIDPKIKSLLTSIALAK